MIISNKIVTNGFLSFDLPKQNYHFISLGAPNRECMIMPNCNGAGIVATVVQKSSSTDTSGGSAVAIDPD